MSLVLDLLAIAPGVGGGEDGVELAVVAAAAVPAVAAAVTATQSELKRIANHDLQWALWTQRVLAVLSIVAFVGAVGLGVVGDVSDAATIYAALTSATLGALSLQAAQRTASARSYSLALDAVDRIKDDGLRDDTLSRLALDVVRRERLGRPASQYKLPPGEPVGSAEQA
ncbi:hypothetical protein ACFWPX_36480 [Nocardia sp. NPDC058518]|uniref:hypothetical protein n=1 Tax=Nocardia sp. NPDC058518 TaxID=3346534 RepID=UPI0036684A93